MPISTLTRARRFWAKPLYPHPAACVRPPRRDIPSHHLTSRAWIVAAQPSRICNFPLTTAFSSLVLTICLAQGERETSKMSPPSPGFASLLLSTGNYQSYFSGTCWFWLHQQLDVLLPSPEQILLEIKLYLSSTRESVCSGAALNLQQKCMFCNFQQEKQGRAGIKTPPQVQSLAFLSERAFGEGLGWVSFKNVEKRQIFSW